LSVNEPHDPELLELAVHEAGHAVGAIALGFTLRSMWIKGPESSSFMNTIDGYIGETDSTACDVTFEHPDADARQRSAIVAMCGREARLLGSSDDDCQWEALERDDQVKALRLVAVGKAVSPAEEGHLLAPIVEAARGIVRIHRPTIELLADHLLRKGIPARMTGPEAMELINESGLAVGAAALQVGRPTKG
jgi:hypothetical protein